jgi:hypothetical protein
MKVLGFHFQDQLLCSSDGDVYHSDYLDFLTKYQDTLNVCYNLDWFIANLCRQLKIPELQLQRFWKSSSLFLPGYNIFFVPHRYLSIQHDKKEVIYTDILQYDPELSFEIDPLEAAKKAQEIGQRVYDVFERFELKPKSLSSPISAYQKEVLSTLDLPKQEDIPAQAQMYAHKCLHGGWQEIFSMGHFEGSDGKGVFDYDITSAFSWHTANLIDTRYGKWLKDDKFHPTGEYPYGFCKGIVTVEKDFNSIIFTHKGKDTESQPVDFTPTGEYPTFLTNAHIQEMERNGEGTFKIESGWYWQPDDELVYPLREHVERLFEWKQYLKGFDKEVVKRILVGLTGKLIETFPIKDSDERKPGKLYNLPWYCWVQDQTKIQVADFVIQNHAEASLLSIAVDGCLFNREIPLKETGEMGTWRLNMVAPAFVISSGVGCIKGKDGKGTFSLNYDWLKAQIESDPNATEYKMSKLTPVTIGNALKNHKVDHLGELETSERAVVLNEVKRFYSERPEKGSDLLRQYNSEPLDVSVLQAESFFTKVNEKGIDK